MSSVPKPVVVVIGNGMVGHKFCEKLMTATSSYQLIVFGEEPRPAYDRVHLSEYFNGKSANDLSLSMAGWFDDDKDIVLHLGDPIREIDRSTRTVHSQKGIHQPYDYLVLATGSSAFVPDINGIEKEGVFVYRTIEDLDAIRAYAAGTPATQNDAFPAADPDAHSGGNTAANPGISRAALPGVRRAAVMGGGLLGLEAAKAMLDLGIPQAHVIEFASRLMPRQIDSAGSHTLESRLKQLGLQLHLNKSTLSIEGDGRIKALQFADDTRLEVDMLVISAGIRPRDELARLAGLPIGTRGGILVNEKLRTSDPFIFAIGECALVNSMIYGLVAPGYEMAEIVAANLSEIRMTNITEGKKTFRGFDMSTKLKLIGVDVASFGDPFIAEPECRTIVFEDRHKGVYKRINISSDGKYLLGGILIGDAAAYNILLQTVNNRILLPSDPEDLILGSRGGAAEGAGVMNLPDEALICSCESVTKTAICQAVTEKGIHSVESMKKCNKAGTGCGGCIPLVKDLITGTMKANGQYIRNVICEHFDHSRQEIFDLVKLNGVRSYDEILGRWGKGDGCEVCKPVAASILASCWNDLIVKQATIQDSNDRYLANIQKGGTYSVVPRIPGGEITPEKLIVLGKVAKKYNLYTKITGGQRIDLFGAHVGDLPDIWEELIRAGFESGHAYGKALRTVKSCVGSTWCRFGLHDSVSFAIEVEERYRGIRAPHKIKGGVSGCIRECAEAQSKDFGIIATEKGWNLYICGNGGSKPQHAQLLATDLDKETVIRYLDRMLMFYIKTADPLTRTATWLNKMEGGMAYLKNVVVHDSLGMNRQWEDEMQTLVDSYACEWKEVVDSPELRKRFVHFVNTPRKKDPEVTFEEMRGQVKAKEW